MARQPYADYNKSWKPVKHIWVDNNGVWTQAKAAWQNVDGVWKQIWPIDPVVVDLVITAGGNNTNVLTKTQYSITAINATYSVVVGSAEGTDSSFGPITKIPSTSNVRVYSAPYPVYNGFLNAYGVWTTPNPSGAPPGTVTVTYTTQLAGGNYKLTASADNHINSISINGGNNVLSEDQWWTTTDTTVYIPPGVNTITVTATNDGGPASFAASLQDYRGVTVWNTRSPINGDVYLDGLIALGTGTGNNGKVTITYTSQTAHPLFTGGDSVVVTPNTDNSATVVHAFSSPGTHVLAGTST